MGLSPKYNTLSWPGAWLGMPVPEDCLYIVLTKVALSEILFGIFFLLLLFK